LIQFAVFACLAAAACLPLAGADGDGTPEFLHLDDPADREAFRRWFTFLAEVQYFTPVTSRPSEINDCAALVRYAYREALREHDEKWSAGSGLPLVPAFDSVHKYSYPHTALGPALFRLKSGPFDSRDLRNGTFAQFANAATLERFNTFRVGHELDRAEAGDLLFFQRPAERMPFHTMVYVGRSQVTQDNASYVVYHTGPEGSRSGEIRRLRVSELLHYPDPQWRPIAANPSFVGVFRWNILRPE
jgi:uncharacterized protein YfaT (DUF1175 family)